MDMDIDSDIAGPMNWVAFKGSCRAACKGFGVDMRQV